MSSADRKAYYAVISLLVDKKKMAEADIGEDITPETIDNVEQFIPQEKMHIVDKLKQ